MTDYEFMPKGVCSRKITLSLDDENKIHNLKFQGGCPGNLAAIGRLLEGRDAREAADILRGNDCAGKGTSCADQLARGLDEILAKRARQCS